MVLDKSKLDIRLITCRHGLAGLSKNMASGLSFSASGMKKDRRLSNHCSFRLNIEKDKSVWWKMFTGQS